MQLSAGLKVSGSIPTEGICFELRFFFRFFGKVRRYSDAFFFAFFARFPLFFRFFCKVGTYSDAFFRFFCKVQSYSAIFCLAIGVALCVSADPHCLLCYAAAWEVPLRLWSTHIQCGKG